MAQSEFGQYDSARELIRGILTDLRTLIREEFALARVEIRQEAGRLRVAALNLGIALAALALGVLFLLIAIALCIAFLLNWPAWGGFLLVAVLLAAGGGLAYRSGRKHLGRMHTLPEQTISTLKENSEWIGKRLSSVRR